MEIVKLERTDREWVATVQHLKRTIATAHSTDPYEAVASAKAEVLAQKRAWWKGWLDRIQSKCRRCGLWYGWGSGHKCTEDGEGG